MTEYELTVADRAWLAEIGVADAPPVRVDASWPTARVLQAAAAGVLTGPNLDVLIDWEQLQHPVSIGAREINGLEATAVTDLVRSGHLVWVGGRITATAKGRELLAVWAVRQFHPRRPRRKGGDRS